MNQPNIGKYAPGTVLTVGSHQCKVLNYITSGGYAQVYTAEMFPNDGTSESNVVCLKRVIVPDKPSLNTLRAEVDAMKLLKDRKYVVSYIDSHAAKSSLQNGSYEVFLLMEFCAGGGLIDFMNTRLQNRFQEFEILNIMSQVTQGIAAMHALIPPLVHRDIKIENVLISQRGEYKVCDFGSVCGVIRPPKNPQELAYVEHDIMKSTTAQYRAPEMIDLYRGFPIDEKSDIWALGVFLYKLCYYTTPFEKGGELAILHSRYEFPAQPLYSGRLKNLIQTMLMESPIQRPNICQVLEEVSRMQGLPCPIRDFYLLRAMEQNDRSKDLQNYQLYNSKTHPTLGHSSIPIINTHHINSLPSMQQATPVPQQMHQITTSNTLSTFIPVPQIQQARSSAHLDDLKSHFQTAKVADVEGGKMYGLQNYQSAHSNLSIASTSPEKSGRGKISQMMQSNPIQYHRGSLYVDSETQTFDTSTSLESKEPRDLSLPKPTVDTMQLTRRALAQSASKTGSSISTNLTAKDQGRSLSPDTLDNHREKPYSLNTKTNDLSSDHTLQYPRLNPVKKLDSKYERDGPSREDSKQAIQKRVHELLNSSEESLQGNSPKEDHDRENADRQTQPIFPHSRKGKATPPPLPPKPAHLRPKKPAKPNFLRGAKIKKEDQIAVLDGEVEGLTRNVRKEVASTL
ncbi:hypothetical protein HG535_0D02050 [Zygotorulaspora mrakii]|uniref:non-specific serine/threonine protein kinase n=1 Tax=Zygotorulaspora mrakii TaxID=42260 RepID=A0A7H9B1X9_ZYGMR|nr:uncharacterized protein HG535_0D02050 [Zygotorulaspora mrakii]QLG72497.1 hypothetical protein HG535_0D02050 [Zygotorulaspora mrakii]